MLGSEWSRFELSRAAKRVVLIADHIVDPACVRQYPNLVRIPNLIVEAVVWWPFGAWPQASPGSYDCDEEHMKLMNKLLATEEGTVDYLARYVAATATREAHLALIGEAKRGELEQGPSAIVTTLGILRPDPETKEFVLDGYFSFSSIEEIQANTGWPLRISPSAGLISEPDAAELAALRRVDVTGALRR